MDGYIRPRVDAAAALCVANGSKGDGEAEQDRLLQMQGVRHCCTPFRAGGGSGTRNALVVKSVAKPCSEEVGGNVMECLTSNN